MTAVNKERFRVLSTGFSNSDDVDEGNPKAHKDGGKMRTLGDNKADDTDNEVKSNTCLVCDGEDDWVLICHGEECPIAVHQSCISDEPDFDEFGNFYCAYCWYKRLVLKCATLGKKLMVIDKSRKGRETLGGVELGLMMDQETYDVENGVEVGVSGGKTLASVDAIGSIREGNGSKFKCMAMEKNRKMKEVAGETHLRGNTKGDDADVDEAREQQRRFSEKNQDTSDACEGRKGRARGSSEKNNEKEQMCNSDVNEEREPHRRYDDRNHETAQAHSFVVGVNTRKKRRYSEKNKQNKTVARTLELNIFINEDGTQGHDYDLSEGRSGQACCHEKNQQKKVSSTERREQEVPRTDRTVLHGSRLGKGRYLEGRHIEKNQHTKTVETETQEMEVSNDRKKRRGVERDRDEFCLVENQDRQFQADVRKDDVAYNQQENCFSKDKEEARKSVSSISSPESTENVNECNAASQELALTIHPNVHERPIEAQPLCSVSSKKPSFQPEKCGHKSYLEKNGNTSNAPGERNFVLCSDKKRRRLFWTEAEEEMLRVGVQKFPGLRNIPWRKILEFGQDVFQGGRVPSDLKDKWKMMNKIPSSTGKWVSLSTERQPNYYVSEVSSE
ncbi:hypothetical protein V5N11_012191 [Cardamine amara subsp. amara]|uniref:Myb-like domain-containing protein n=1 Tax=Cardamine amara subsp. amara TaxID=228776 RepID=A0ABD0Z411_CARAN